MKNYLTNNLVKFAWLLSIGVTFLSVFVWLERLNFNVSGLTTYQYFPVLGLIAFSIMWSHYIVGALRVYTNSEKQDFTRYTKITGYIVLFAIILHPGLIILQLYLDNYGLPPGSYVQYAGETGSKFILIGTTSWLAFLAYEFKEKIHSKPWWKYVLIANALAMIGILIHSLKLGSHLQSGYYRYIWIFYGITLISSLAYLTSKKKLY